RSVLESLQRTTMGEIRPTERGTIMSHDSDNKEPTELTNTVPTKHGASGADAQSDVQSDPALDDNVGTDWADEGGATPVGPATATADSDDEADEADEAGETED